MSKYEKLATETADKYLATMSESQEAFLKSISTFAPSAYTPSAFTPWTAAAPKQNFATNFPSLREITEVNFAFATKFLTQQKRFVEKLLAASLPSNNAPAKRAATKSTTSKPATRTRAKK